MTRQFISRNWTCWTSSWYINWHVQFVCLNFKMINFRFLFSFTIILYFVIIIDKECTTFQIKFFRKIFIIISNFFIESLYYYGQKVKQLTRYYYMHICIYVNIPLYLILECSALPRIRYFRKKKNWIFIKNMIFQTRIWIQKDFITINMIGVE